MTDKYEEKLDTQEQKTQTSIESNDFPKVKEFVTQEGLEEEKSIINKILNDNIIKEGFENFLKTANLRTKLKIKKELQNCKNEEEVKSIIVENLPGYKIGELENNKNALNKLDNGTNTEENSDLGFEIGSKQEKEEQADQDKIIRDQKTEQADKNKTETEEQNKKTEIIGNASIAHAKRDELRLKYDGLQQKTDKGSDLYNEVEKNLKNSGVINQLEEIGKNIKDSNFVEKYISFQATLQELKSNPTIYEPSDISSFDKIVKNLENSCNIPDTNLNSFSKDNIGDTRKEMFNADVGNNNLISARDSNKESHSAEYGELFKDTDMMDTIKKYGKFFPEGAKQYLKKYEEYYKSGKALEYENSDEGKKLKETLLNVKLSVDNYTENFIEEMCLMSQIKGMYMCMGEGENFNLNKAKEIESENGILTLRGHIDGVDFVIRQDTTKESPLQISSKLYKNNESLDDTDKNNDFIIGGKDKFVNSNFILPTQDEIFTMITENIKSDNLLQNADNYEKYLEILQNNIMVNIDNKYEKTKYAHHYMQEQVKGEKIIDKTISFVEKLKGTDIDSRINNSSAQLYNFLNLMDFNIKHSTSAEKDKLYRIMDKIDRMTGLAQYNSSDGELLAHHDKFSQYLTGDSLLNTRSTLKGNQVEGSNKYAFDLFKNYENLSDERKFGGLHMINFDQMLVDLNKVEIQQKEKQEKTTRDLALSKLDEDLEIAYA